MATTTERIVALEAKLDRVLAAIEAAPARSRAAKPAAARTFATKAERDAGKGYPCTADEPCARRDLRTAAGASSHDPKHDGWHTPKS